MIHVVTDACVVKCRANMDVVIGVRVVLCCPLVNNPTFQAFYFVPNSHCCHAVAIHPTFTCSHFSHVLHRIPAALEVWYLQNLQIKRLNSSSKINVC